MKKILGLDLGTNSIGWALTEQNFEKKQGNILGMGSRIIPMDATIMGEFEKGNKVSQTADRTNYRSIRRLRERELLRRERLHRVMNLLGFLPEHYANQIDFEENFGQFKKGAEPKLPYLPKMNGEKAEFIFKNSYMAMLDDFKANQPELVAEGRKVPYDWTIYFLRKKALTHAITREELAWLILNFNQKRGYFQLRGEDDDTNQSEIKEYVIELRVINIAEGETDKKNPKKKWVSLTLENGWIYKATFNILPDWLNKSKEFLITEELDENGLIKIIKNKKNDSIGEEKRRIQLLPTFEEIELMSFEQKNKIFKKIKIKTEITIRNSGKTVGSYIYDSLLKNPTQKVRGKLVRTIERKFYKDELKLILEKQKEFHNELTDEVLYIKCIDELYHHNEVHSRNITKRDFTYLFVDDILFYQRPLKSKKSLISECQYETRTYRDKDNKVVKQGVKCIPKSHPLFQEFRLWQFIHNLRIYEKLKTVDGKTQMDFDVTNHLLGVTNRLENLFKWLNDRKEIEQTQLIKYLLQSQNIKGKNEIDKYRWNYVENKKYPCNVTRNTILNKLDKNTTVILTKDLELKIWHLLYSINTKAEIDEALKANKQRKSKTQSIFGLLTSTGFTANELEAIKKINIIEKDYGSYSEKALKKILPLLRRGEYWNASEKDILQVTKDRISAIKNRLDVIDYDIKKIETIADDDIPKQVLKSFVSTKDTSGLQGLNTYQACYAVYGRHSESANISFWKSPYDIEHYLKNVFKHHELRNPTVEQVIKETLKVVIDIWKYFGNSAANFFDEIHIELGRDMKNSAEERKRITDNITQNENTNLRIKALIAELKNDSEYENVRPYSPSQQEILKIYEDGVLKSGIELPEDIAKIYKTSTPTKSELIRYKLWLEQKYQSPYTREIIPLSKLFTSDYQIEHIIPQSRFFDDSLSNKVICESEVNQDKDNQTAYEYISNNQGKKIELSFGKVVTIQTIDEYEKLVNEYYKNNRPKLKKLLMNDIPDKFVERQLNDTRYISKAIKNILSNIVREAGEEAVTSKNLVSSNGSITDKLKHDWGMNDVWNDIVYPRFERLNKLTSSNDFGKWEDKDGKKVFQTTLPLSISKGFSKKRIDHRHHALDALIVACATSNHINYLNNEYAKESQKDLRFDLRKKLCEKVYDKNNPKNYKWLFYKPWDSITENAKEKLHTTVVSFKQNLRVLTKTSNYFVKWKLDENGKALSKVSVKQTKGDSWSIRKSLHKDTVKGIISLRCIKKVSLLNAIDESENIVINSLKKKIRELKTQGLDKKLIQKYFIENKDIWPVSEMKNIAVYYFDNTNVASRVFIDESFTSQKIEERLTDTGIQKILLNHLRNFTDDSGNEHPELAFAPEGIETMNKNIISLNGGKSHQPIYKVRIFEAQGNKFEIGIEGNKNTKFVEAAKGTNLYFAIYNNVKGRNFNTIPIVEIIKRIKKNQSPVPERDKYGNDLLFYLNPNDMVYVPTEKEIENNLLIDFEKLKGMDYDRIYKFVSCTENEGHFVPFYYSSPIIKNEMGTNNKSQNTIDGKFQIKSCCVKLTVDRLGNIEPYIQN